MYASEEFSIKRSLIINIISLSNSCSRGFNSLNSIVSVFKEFKFEFSPFKTVSTLLINSVSTLILFISIWEDIKLYVWNNWKA